MLKIVGIALAILGIHSAAAFAPRFGVPAGGVQVERRH